MTRLNLITFASVFQKQEEQSVRAAHRELFESLDASFDIHMYLHGTLNDVDKTEWNEGITVLFIATGGTEGLVVKHYTSLPKPTVLLTDGKANSLAASLELACWIRQRGDRCQIIHGEMDYVTRRLSALAPVQVSVHPGKRLMQGQRIGVVGQPSDWLVASGVDYVAAHALWGVEYVDIPLNKVEQYYAEDTTDSTAEADRFLGQSARCVEPTHQEICKAVRLYHALHRVAVEYKLDALTLQCFSLIPSTGTTGCLALALLNDEGIVAGCEGDLQSIFTLLLAKRATDTDGFMANPSLINVSANTLILAHCTIGLKQTSSYVIRSHFESQSGVAIQGILPLGEVTIVKCGGQGLEKHAILTGHIVENQDDPGKCRTQLLIQLDAFSPVSYFFERNIGNHHIVLQGNHRTALEQLF